MPRRKMPKRPKKSTAIKTPAKTAKEKKKLMPAVKPSGKPKPKPKKEETFGKKVGSRPRREIGKRRQMEKDLLADL